MLQLCGLYSTAYSSSFRHICRVADMVVQANTPGQDLKETTGQASQELLETRFAPLSLRLRAVLYIFFKHRQSFGILPKP